MGREVRYVPKNWEHPKTADGSYKPLIGDKFSECLAEWEEDKVQWGKGLRRSCSLGPEKWKPIESDDSFDEWVGVKPDPANYMPEFELGVDTHLMMYEDCSEGTPISPAFATQEELARWLAVNNASAFGPCTATYEQWLATIKMGSAPSAVIGNLLFDGDSKGFRSGVEASGDK